MSAFQSASLALCFAAKQSLHWQAAGVLPCSAAAPAARVAASVGRSAHEHLVADAEVRVRDLAHEVGLAVTHARPALVRALECAARRGAEQVRGPSRHH